MSPVAWRRRREVVWTLALLAAGAVALVRGESAGGLNDWNATHWFFSYELEFVRRGLVGSVVRAIFGEPTKSQVELLSLLLFVVLGISLLAYALWATSRQEPALRWSLAFVIASCPATLIEFAYDAGRFDQLNLILTLAALVLLQSAPRLVLMVVPIVGLGILVHEAFLFVNLPLLVVAAMLTAHDRRRALAFGLTLAIAGVATAAAVVAFGTPETLDHQAFSERIVQRYGVDSEAASLSAKPLYRSVGSNVTLTMEWWKERPLVRQLLVAAVLLSPYLWIVGKLLRGRISALSPDRRPLLLLFAATPLGCVPLMFLGVDLFRWIGLMVVNLLLITLFIMRADRDTKLAFPLSPRATAALVLLGYAVGPLGITRAFIRVVFL